GLCLGVRGAVGSTYNFAAPHYLKLIQKFESGDLPAARRAQHLSLELVKVLGEFGFLAASKAVMAILGVDCGPVRSPLRNLEPIKVPALAQKRGAFDFLARPFEADV